MMNGGVKQRPLQTKWSLFFSYFNFMDIVDQSAESGPQPGPWEGLLCVGHMARALVSAAASPDWVRKCSWHGPRCVDRTRAERLYLWS